MDIRNVEKPHLVYEVSIAGISWLYLDEDVAAYMCDTYMKLGTDAKMHEVYYCMTNRAFKMWLQRGEGFDVMTDGNIYLVRDSQGLVVSQGPDLSKVLENI